MGQQRQLLVILPASTAYRAPFFDRVVPLLGDRGIHLSVIQGQGNKAFMARGDAVESDWCTSVPVRSGPGRLRRLELRSWRTAGIQPDLVVVQQALTNLETYPMLARSHLGGPSVAAWGHGRNYSTPQSPAMAAVKQFLTQRCDWFFAYTPAGADHVISHGFPATRVSVLNNTIDTEALRRDLDSIIDSDLEAFSRGHGLTPGRTALFLGGVDHAKGIDFLLRTATIAEQMLPGFVLLVGGAGEQLGDVQAAQRSGAPVRALGRLDGREKALALRATDLLALPSSIGLVAVDSLVAGVPIVTRDNSTHGPEAEYLVDGVTARLVDGAADEREYARALTALLLDRTQLLQMSRACLADSTKYSLGAMVDSFVEGVLAWDDVVRARL